MKIKYLTLSKEEKIKSKEKFYQTDFGKNIKTKLSRLLLTGILGICFSIFLFITYKAIWELAIGIILLICSFVFIVASFRIRIIKINDFITKKK